MILDIEVLKDEIRFTMGHIIIAIDRNPFFKKVDTVEYLGDGNIHFKYRNDIELVHLPSLCFGEFPLYIPGEYRSYGERFDNKSLIDKIKSVTQLEVHLVA